MGKAREPLALTTTGPWAVCRYPLAGKPTTSGVGNVLEKRHIPSSSSESKLVYKGLCRFTW